MGRPKKAEPTEQVRLARSIARRLRVLAAHARRDASDLLADLIREPLEAAEKKMRTDWERETGTEATEPKKPGKGKKQP